MPESVFLQQNTAPQLAMQDQNFTTNSFFARKTANLTIDSASGWRSPGPLEPGSYNAPLNTTTNKTKLGAVKVNVSQHVNDQEMTMTEKLIGLTVFGMELKNGNKIEPVLTYVGTADTTVVAASGTVNGLGLTAATGFAEGMVIEIAMGSGITAYKEYRRILVLDTTDVLFDYPLFEAPADAAVVKGVQDVDFAPGGSGLRPYSALTVCSGDEYADRLIHYFPDVRKNQGNVETPDANVGMISLDFEVFAQRKAVGAGFQPVFGTERIRFASPA